MEKDNSLPSDFTLEQLSENYALCVRQYNIAFRRAIVLDTTDKRSIWEAINAKFPPYQILPDTNHVSYTKSNILASIYTVGKSARLMPTSKEDAEVVEGINQFLEFFWHTGNVGFFQMQAGERAALINLGITQVGWDTELTGGNGDFFYKGAPTFRNINPLKFMRDPSATGLDTAAFCIYWDDFHKTVLEKNKLYSKAIQALKADAKYESPFVGDTPAFTTDKTTPAISDKDYMRVVIHWVKDGKKIHEIHTLNNKEILCVKKDIKPSKFPFALLFCNLPGEDLIGTSEPAKIFANSLAYNLMNSISLTAEYKNQRPPRFINGQSGISLDSFTKHGNDADKVFLVNGVAKDAVHYQVYPSPSAQLGTLNEHIAADITAVTGIDGRYTGRDTGSILTTGGIDSMLAQATLIDAPKILCYEEYAKQLTQLVLGNLVEFSSKRTYLRPDGSGKHFAVKQVDFPSIDAKTAYSYEISISSELPKSKQRIAEFATKIMEMQLQYKQSGAEVDLMQPEEWLYFQDSPIREYMTERMGIERLRSVTEDVAETIVGFSELTKNGMDADLAVDAMAQNLLAKRNPAQAESNPLMDPAAMATAMGANNVQGPTGGMPATGMQQSMGGPPPMGAPMPLV